MTFVNERGEVVEAGKDIALHYVKGKIELELHIIRKSSQPKGWFVPDLVAALPFDLLYATCSLHYQVSYNNHLVSTWRLLCALSLHQALREGKLNNAFEKDKRQRVCDWEGKNFLSDLFNCMPPHFMSCISRVLLELGDFLDF